jgi:predicted transcriptional regulator
LRESSVCGRLVELCAAGLVVKTEDTRPTSSGRHACVYKIAEKSE